MLKRRRPVWQRTAVWQGVAWFLPLILATIAVLRWGVGMFAIAVIGLLALPGFTSLPSWIWAAFAVTSTTLGGLATSSGVLPSVFVFADFGFVYIGLISVLARNWSVPRAPEARRLSRALLLLLAVILASWVLHPSDAERPFVTFLLWAEPFALILMMLIEPPSKEQQRWLLGLLTVLVAIQLPFAVYQARTAGVGDPVVGTLVGYGAGAHLMAGIAILGGVSLMVWGYHRSVSWGLLATLLAAPFTILIPVLADAKQVTFALPFAGLVLLIAVPGLIRKIGVLVPIAGALLVLLLVVPTGRTAVMYLENASQGRSGKLIATDIILEQMKWDPSAWFFGFGPANGISRAAFMTTPALGAESPISVLGLQPATIPSLVLSRIEPLARATSFNSPVSSALGVFSDIGIVGVLVFTWMIACVCIPLLRTRTWVARAALAGWIMSFPLAITFDWWEEPPFMLLLALLTGVALADRQRFSRSQRPRTEIGRHEGSGRGAPASSP